MNDMCVVERSFRILLLSRIFDLPLDRAIILEWGPGGNWMQMQRVLISMYIPCFRKRWVVGMSHSLVYDFSKELFTWNHISDFLVFISYI